MENAKRVVVEQLARRNQRIAEIMAGDLPTTAQRLAGYPPLGGHEKADRLAFLTKKLAEIRVLDGDVELYERARDAIDAKPLWDLWTELSTDDPTKDRLLVYLALEFFNVEAQDMLASVIRQDMITLVDLEITDHAYALAFAAMLDKRPNKTGLLSFKARLDGAFRDLVGASNDVLAVKAALTVKPDAPMDENLSPLNALSRLAHKLDDAERHRRLTAHDSDPKGLKPLGRSLIVVPPLGAPTGSSARKDVYAQFAMVAGVALPLADDADQSRVRSKLAARYPHLATEVDLILRQQQPYRLLLVGSPGCGKTSFARDLADQLGLASIVYTAGGTADSSFAGTSAQWATSRASTPLQLVLRSRRANPLIVLDELEKTGDSRHNGSLVDALLSFLEPSSARRILDPALEVEVDLGAISYVATANSLDGVPGPLRDRLRVIRMPDPRPEHLPQLLTTMLDDIADERGLDRRWLQPLAGDELEIVQQVWPGGSLRRLRRVLELMLDGREQQMGRA